jgi:predicted aspartyl protease
MRGIALISILLFALPEASASAQPATSVLDIVQQAQPVDSTTQADDVKVRKDANDRMTVAVRLGGSGPFRFLVDTGADRTAISSAVAARLGLQAGESASLHSMTGMSSVHTVNVPSLQLSRSDLRIVDAPLLDADKMGADGILGTDSLRSQRVMFDFESNLMTIVPSEQRLSKDDGTIVVTGRLKNGRLIVTNATADENVITVILDTGAEVCIGNEALRQRLAKDGLLRNTGAVQLQSVTGDMLDGQYTFVKKLEMGGVTMTNLAVVFADAHTFKQLGLDDRPALLLGMNALRAFKKVSIDFANKKLRVVLPETGSLSPVMMAAR